MKVVHQLFLWVSTSAIPLEEEDTTEEEEVVEVVEEEVKDVTR